MERLQKHLARAGVCSRRAAERLIEAGRVQVNGRIVTELGTQVDSTRDVVRVDGARVDAGRQKPVYLMLNKPRGYVTTMSDPQGRPTVRDLLLGLRTRVFPVGRLDFNSEGLLLLTNDGDLARDLTHPRGEVPKTYSARVRGQPEAQALRRLSEGVVLDGRRTRATGVRVIRPGRNSWVELTIREGRKHIVRRLLQAIGHPVVKLRRTRYGGVPLGKLEKGTFRHLTPEELGRLRQAPKGAKPARGRGVQST